MRLSFAGPVERFYNRTCLGSTLGGYALITTLKPLYSATIGNVSFMVD